jgi:AGZA family xanthine/uracil permease-like MFS transporter
VKQLERLFQLNAHETTFKREMLAGATSFFTVAYIVIINAMILADSGIPFEAAVLATVLTSFLGCWIMGFWANAPIVLVPGMGVNAFFTYTVVHDLGLTWQEALGVIFLSGLIATLTAATKLGDWLAALIPVSLKKGTTVGIGLLITFMGLQKGGLIVTNEQTFVAIGDLANPKAWLTLVGLALTAILLVRQVLGSFLIGLLSVTVLGILTGQSPSVVNKAGSNLPLKVYADVFGHLSFSGILRPAFWTATFILAMVLVFENLGVLQGLLQDQRKFRPALLANSITAMLSGLLGTSPTVCSLESAAGIATGGKTGLTAITSGLFFLTSLFFLPLLKWIPDSAVAAVLIIVGGLIIQEVQSIPFSDYTEGIPAFITFAFIPFTYSIPDGIAFGFIAYAVLKIAARKAREVPAPFFILALLFLVQLSLHS